MRVKDNLSFEQQLSEEEMVWITPNGYVIPASERHNWEEYVAQRFTQRPKKIYSSRDCTTADGKCGLECYQGGTAGDCSTVSGCTPCMNCGCTPIRSPYE